MDKVVIVAIAAIAAMSLIGFLSENLSITGLFVGFRSPDPTYEWWNASWKYRFQVNMDTNSYDRTNWPVEFDINFTDQMPSGTFDNNSIRVIEYDSGGSIVKEVTSQFDELEGYDNSTNALGTLSFVMDGFTASNVNRTYFVYYDAFENGAKQNPGYSTGIEYDLDGDEFLVNNTIFHFRVDSIRGDRTAGIYRVRGLSSSSDLLPYPVGANDRTFEYIEYSNGTSNFSFNFASSPVVISQGPVKLVVQMSGDEVFWNTTTQTNEGFGTRQYTFYDGVEWVRTQDNYTNLGASSIMRNSTTAGAVRIDAQRAFGASWQSGFGNTTQPGWWFASDLFSSFHWGIVHVNQSGTSNYWVPNASSQEVMGVRLNQTTIGSGSSIIEQAAMHFNETSGDFTVVRGLRDRLSSPVSPVQFLPERSIVEIQASANVTILNRNETILLLGDTSSGDPFNLTQSMNATLDLGVGGDSSTIQMSDDGTGGDSTPNDRIFSGEFGINNTAAVGTWTVNLTSFSNDTIAMNWSTATFTVTDILNLSTNVTNGRAVSGEFIFSNVTVQNYREDTFISGASIGCRYEGPGFSDVTNITDVGGGWYEINFTAPGTQGNYNLICNATSNGNFGNDTDTFIVEPPATAVEMTSIPVTPSVLNVTEYGTDNFTVASNSTNIGNGTAYDINVTLGLYSGWAANSTFENCGNLLPSESCLRGFDVQAASNTSPGVYQINFTVDFNNPDGSSGSNVTQINVNVASNPFLDVFETDLPGTVGDGISNVIGNFTVGSVGNDDLQDVTYSCSTGFACTNSNTTFLPDPVNITLFQNQSVQLTITPDPGIPNGTHTGVVNVSSQTSNYDTFNVTITVPDSTNVSVTKDIDNYNATDVTLVNSETFNFSSNATNEVLSSARSANISLNLPSGWTSNASSQICGYIVSQQTCTRGYGVTIPGGTLPGNYTFSIQVDWENADGSLGSNVTDNVSVEVFSGPAIDIAQSTMSTSIGDGATVDIGDFSMQSVGNDALENVSVTCSSGTVCSNMTVVMAPTFVSTMPVNTSQNVNVDITVPIHFPSGIYTGTAQASAQNDGFDTVTFNITVPDNRTWSISTTFCQSSLEVQSGTMCEVNVTNLGNTQINFTVSPQQQNFTEVNETSFVLNSLESNVFEVTYNTTGQPPDFYNATYVVDAVDAGSSPDSENLVASLVPFLSPLINVTVIPNLTDQSSSVYITANVTDQSTTGINFTRVNVTLPNGTVDTLDMSLLSTSGNLTRWDLTYPNGTTGSTILTGVYNVTVFSEDDIGDFGTENSTFTIHKRLDITMATLSNRYFQGDDGSIFYTVRDLTGDPIENVSVNFTIRDGTGNITYLSGNLLTDADGTISPFPTFTVANDALVENYTVTASSSDFDQLSNQTLELQTNYTFEVLPSTVTVSGLFADVETSVVWYPQNVMKFGIITYNGEGQPITPTSLNMTVFDPAGNVYFTTTLPSLTQENTGFYTYQYAMPVSTPTGMFLAVLDVEQDQFRTTKLNAFRVSAGGPFDLRLFLFENEVPPGTDLDYSINIENKGEVSQDVFLDYWVSQNNVTFTQYSEAIFAPGLSNQTFSRQISLFSTLTPGTYLLNARMVFNGQQPAIIVNKSFLIVSSPPPPPTTSSGPSDNVVLGDVSTATVTVPVTSRIPADLIIEKYTENITLARGFTKLENVIVTNVGTVDLSNITLLISGVAPDWYSITPEVYRKMSVENSSVFVITFEIPDNAATGEYPATLVASSGVVSDQKQIFLTVVDTLDEALRIEIEKLKSELQDLEVAVRVGQIQGKDVEPVLLLVEQIKEQIRQAEENLEEGETELVAQNIKNARNLMDRAWDILDQLEIQQVSLVIPFDIIYILLAVVAGTFVVLFVLWKKNKLPSGIRSHMLPLVKAVEKMKVTKVVPMPIDTSAERSRLSRMLEVLEKERNDRIISLGAYTEMKKSIEKKLNNLDKKRR